MVSVFSRVKARRHKSKHRTSREERVGLTSDAIERDHRENGRGAAIVVVVCEESRVEELKKEWKKHRWQLWKKKPFVRATTDKRLQDTINKVSRNQDVNHLTIIACEGIYKLSPQVYAPHIQNMRILRCGRQDHLQKDLDIGDDAFRFNNKALGDCAPQSGYNGSWEFNCNANITLGREEPSIPLWNESDASDYEKHEGDSPSGIQETKTSGGWWKSWRGIIAGAVGLVVAAAKAVSSVVIAAKGYCLGLSWKSISVCFAKGSGTASLSTSAACVAVAYGLVAFLIVYLGRTCLTGSLVLQSHTTTASCLGGTEAWQDGDMVAGSLVLFEWMPTTLGTVSSFDGGHKISATFVVDGVQCTFNGSFDPPVGDFNSYDAKLDYSDIKQLTTQREFSGKVSSQSLVIDTNNGAKITTHPDTPISPVSRLSGRGNWEHS
ncbi:hypothetical protein NW768_002665 [Fusarium equiseti]|uniref:Uncharacterized protein n=1 Tax=Fusarium equiseti TaxID=61235 RepID=A0ABQ8RPX0_FUSEQ|nr:hypothetical protein NW768_002665 [Fusarium equiseti]